MATLTAGPGMGLNMSAFDADGLANGDVSGSSASQVIVDDGTTQFVFTGAFVLDGGGQATSGTLTGLSELQSGVQTMQIAGLSLDWADALDAIGSGDRAVVLGALLGGADSLAGSASADTLSAYAGADTVSGGAGGDVIDGGDGASYLRGDDGDDQIDGGSDFDDINGNMGDDTAHGYGGGDWVVGGKDGDMLFGDDGGDIVYGNIGNDTCDGGTGNDIVRGGRDNDTITGGAGDDWLSGDRGDDTVQGGAGADIFHSFGDAAVDRVLDFSLAEGDRVQLDPGTTYTTAQVGADAVISMTGGGQMILAGVSLSTLTGNWIFTA
jgi:Ca2+-binding RTX toxin-like protein